MADLGDLLYRGASLWLRLVGNTTTTKKFLRQTGTGSASAAPAWDPVADADLSVTDITTNNVTIGAHGFAPKAPNDTTKYLRGRCDVASPARRQQHERPARRHQPYRHDGGGRDEGRSDCRQHDTGLG